jgi:hypothetical protein
VENIEAAAAKAYVIVPYKGILPALKKAVEKEIDPATGRPRYTAAILNGDVPLRQRDKIIKDFTDTPEPHVLLCHPKVMSHGLDLTVADYCIFYAPIFSNDENEQVQERFNRAGQTRKMTIVRMAAHPMEWEIYRAVDSKKVTQDTILNLYKSVVG